MCGICGVVSPEANDAEISAVVWRMVRCLAHRGPDDRGIMVLDGGRLAFGQTRLSILDLSPAGHQPMCDPLTGNWTVFNGELYNFRQLRHDLERRGHTFRSDGDTEVLLRSFGEHGLAAVSGWRGMFACAIWEQDTGALHLIRDRLGIKPLYYYHDGARLLFASELRALLSSGCVPRRVNRAAIGGYLACGAVPEPLTPIVGVYALPPGHMLTLRDGCVQVRDYWDAAPGAGEGVSEEHSIADLRATLRDAARAHLVSDVPLGAFLSGGVDSGIVAALIQEETGRAHTFCVGFPDAPDDESALAARAARHLGTVHRTIPLSHHDVLDALPAFLSSLDLPSVDGFNTYVVSRAARQAGITVALSGLGADELFGGYPIFRQVPRLLVAQRVWTTLPSLVRSPAAAAFALAAGPRRRARLSAVLPLQGDGDHPYAVLRALLEPRRLRPLLDDDPSASPLSDERYAALTLRRFARARTLDPFTAVSYLELTGYLCSTLLRDADSMSMAHGLELRVPFLDHLLVEHVMRLPGHVKGSGRRPKALLIAAAGERLLPETLAGRKRGFEFPFACWLRGPLRRDVESVLLDSRLVRDSGLRPQGVQALWRDFQAGRDSWMPSWSVYVLLQWLRRHS